MPTKPLLILMLTISTSILHAQDYNPFKSIGKKGKILTASNGRFVEVFDYDSIQRIGSVMFNIRTKKIVKLLNADAVFGKFSNNSSSSRFLSIDPLAYKLVSYSPYSFAVNNPILFYDKDGKFPFIATVRAFAPTGAFKGSGFEDDHRGYSASQNVTSRITQSYTVDPTKRTVFGGTPTSSDTRWNGHYVGNATNTTDEGKIDNKTFFKNSFGSDVASVDAHFKGSNPAPVFLNGTLAPDIKVNSTITLSENDKQGYVVASVDISSKQFPATEALLADSKGQSVILVGAAAYGDAGNLMSADVEKAATIDIRLDINKQGEFTGVEYGGKTYSINDWNKMQQAKPAGPFDRNDKDKKQQ